MDLIAYLYPVLRRRVILGDFLGGKNMTYEVGGAVFFVVFFFFFFSSMALQSSADIFPLNGLLPDCSVFFNLCRF